MASHPGVPGYVCDEITGVVEGEDLRRERAKRPSDERIERLEEKHDRLERAVTETRVIVGELNGKLEVLPQLVSMVRQTVERAVARQDADHNAQVLDDLDARKHRRQRITQVLGLVLSGGVVVEILHWLAGRL